MATCSEIEKWLATVGTGITGLKLLKEYKIKTPELRYFVEAFGNGSMKISAFAPPTLKNQYEERLGRIEKKLKLEIRKLLESEVSAKSIDNALKSAEELYSLLRDMCQAVVSSFLVV